MKQFFYSIAVAFATLWGAGCATATEPNYSVDVPLGAALDGQMAYIVNYDSGEPVDSAVISGGEAHFKGYNASDLLARVVAGGKRIGTFVLEPGTITFNESGDAYGTVLNERLNEFGHRTDSIANLYRSLPDEAARRARGPELQSEFQKTVSDFLAANENNAIGFYLLMQQIMEMDSDQLEAAVAQYPMLAGSKRVEKLRSDFRHRRETSAGNMFKDFEITQPDGTVKKLSDYVGKGKYTIVDFWASWCGPCIRATRTLKQLYETYNNDGKLDFLGVAVWDEPQNTLDAIESHELPWPQILNAQSVPTELYGIPGIPCIILFDPDGRIVFRDLQGQELIDATNQALSPKASE